MKTTLITSIFAGLLLIGLAGCADQLSDSRPPRAAGVKMLAAQDYDGAAGAFRNAVRQEPRDYRSHYYLGVCYDAMGEYHLAIQSFRAALAVPHGIEDLDQTPLPRTQIIDALAKTVAGHDSGDTELNAIEADARAYPKSESYVIMARIFRDRQDVDSAQKCYAQAVILAPGDFDLHKEYGFFLLDVLHQDRAAEPQLRRAYVLNSEDAQVAEALRQLGTIPGPALKDQSQLASPIIPRGPLPEVDVTQIDLKKLFNSGNSSNTNSNNTAKPVAAPHD